MACSLQVLQLMVVPPRLYVSDCPSISEGKIRGSEVGQRFGSSEVSSKKSEKRVRDVCQKVIFRLEKEDYVICLLYYKVRSW